MKSSTEVLTVQTAKLNGELKEYTFQLVQAPEVYTLKIPGHGSGPDGPRIPDHPEQEKWMRQLNYLKEVWHLTWECGEEYEFRRFKKAVKGLGKLTKK
ncbi:MAG: hypothetical protein AAF694_28410 [Bacteroidota bacterium]